MAAYDICVSSLRFVLFAFVTWKIKSLGVGLSPVEGASTNHVTITAGEKTKMVYKARTKELTLTALEFGQWTYNEVVIVSNSYFLIGNNTTTRRFWLKIREADVSKSGIYSFVVNGTAVQRWELQVKSGLSPCGEALDDLVSHCSAFSETNYPNCTSFPGPPLEMQVMNYLHKGKPVVQVTWEAPNTGRHDLWGYDVYLVGKNGHPGHYQCVQINSKTDHLHWIFLEHILYGAAYQVNVQSMPAYHRNDGNAVSKDVTVPVRCQFPEHRNSAECCSLVNITAEYFDKEIHLTWRMSSEKHCREINMFNIKWLNIQKPGDCHGQTLIEGEYNCTISLSKECSRFNYSIRLSGKTNDTEGKLSKVTVIIPPMKQTPSPFIGGDVQSPPADNTTKILISVLGSFFGVVICTLLVVYRIFFQQVRITLPYPPKPSTSRPSSDQPLLGNDSGKKRVLILHTRCCEKCNHVLHCLGTVLSSTELIEPSIDMWNTLDISPNVPRWYEEQVKTSDCVIVLGSRKMSLRCQNLLEEGDDPLQIKCQLNFVRGNIAKNPDTQKFIPAFFTYNGSKKDIPDFLSYRWSHKLPREVDRVIFHVLNVEKIQPYRTQPIVVMGGNGHPFDEKKKELERAVQEADTYHKCSPQV